MKTTCQNLTTYRPTAARAFSRALVMTAMNDHAWHKGMDSNEIHGFGKSITERLKETST